MIVRVIKISILIIYNKLQQLNKCNPKKIHRNNGLTQTIKMREIFLKLRLVYGREKTLKNPGVRDFEK